MSLVPPTFHAHLRLVLGGVLLLATCLVFPEVTRAASPPRPGAATPPLPAVTPIRDLPRLAASARPMGVQVRVRGVVTYRDAEWKTVWIQDGGAGLGLYPPELDADLKVGDEIEVTGTTNPTDDPVTLGSIVVRRLGEATLPEPATVEAERLTSADLGKRVRFTGTARQVLSEADRLTLQVMVGRVRIICRVRGTPPPEEAAALPGARVRVTGVASKRMGGRPTDHLELLVASLEDVVVERPQEPPWRDLPLAPMNALPRPGAVPEAVPLVRVEGRVVSRRGATASHPGMVRLAGAGGSVNAILQLAQVLEEDRSVQVWGFPAVVREELLLEDAFGVPVPDTTQRLSAPAVEVSVEHPGLTNLLQVRSLSRAEAARRLPAVVEGVVTFVEPGAFCFVQDTTGAAFILGHAPGVEAGRQVRVRALTDAGGVGRMLVQPRFEVLGPAAFPEPVRVAADRLMTEAMDCVFAELEGVVHAVEGGLQPRLRVASGPRAFAMTIQGIDAGGVQVRPLVDAKIRARGVATPTVNAQDQISGILLRVPSLQQIEVLEPAPASPFAIPERPIGSVAAASPALVGPHRVRVHGRITLVRSNRQFTVQDPTGSIRVTAVNATDVRAGEPVEVAGFAVAAPLALRLEEALVQREADPVDIQPIPVESGSLLDPEAAHERLIRVEARLLNDAPGSSRQPLVLQAGDIVFTAHFTGARDEFVPPRWRAGSQLRLEGVGELQTDAEQRPAGFLLHLQDRSSIDLLHAPPWWTLRHTLGLGIVLLGSAAGALAWAELLRRKVRERTEEIRARIEAEADLSKRLALVWEASMDGLRITDVEGRVVRVNEAYCRLVERPRAELEGHHFTEAVAPELRETLRAAHRARFALRRHEALGELEMVLWNGSRLWVDITDTPFDPPGSAPLMLTRVRNVTSKRRADEQLRHVQKMDAVGQLAGGVAHDFNNILTAMLLELALLQQEPGNSRVVSEGLKELTTEAQRAAELTRQLLLFSRRQMQKRTALDLNHIVEGTMKMLRRLLGEQIEVSFEPGTALPLIQADAGMVEQVITNLAVNARDAMPKGGRLELRTDTVETTADPGRPAARPGRFLRLTVSDTGCGMDPATLARIFEPFFTTKPVGKGTGLGLATVYGIVQQHQGWIDVASTPGSGTRFEVYFPISGPPAAEPDGGTPAPGSRGRGETVLLVEDDPSLRRVSARSLRAQGYVVLEAADGTEALAVAEKQGTRLDLVVADIIMPGLGGRELGERLAERFPGLRCLFVSGYSADALLTRHVAPPPAGAFLPKPYTEAELIARIRATLDAGAPPPARHPEG